MTSFDSIQAAALQPPESRPCAPDEHVIDPRTLDADTDWVTVRCEFCDATQTLRMTEWIL